MKCARSGMDVLRRYTDVEADDARILRALVLFLDERARYTSTSRVIAISKSFVAWQGEPLSGAAISAILRQIATHGQPKEAGLANLMHIVLLSIKSRDAEYAARCVLPAITANQWPRFLFYLK